MKTEKPNDTKTMKEQISLRIDPEVKKILEEIATRTVRSLGNVAEKLILERLQQLNLLDDRFQAKPIKPTKSTKPIKTTIDDYVFEQRQVEEEELKELFGEDERDDEPDDRMIHDLDEETSQ